MEEQVESANQSGTAVNVTDGREARSEGWYVARVQMNCEKKSALRLTDLGIETYVPTQTVIRQWSDRKKKIEKILIPLIVFFKADEDGAKQVQRLSFVYDLLKAPGERKAAVIPDSQIQKLMFMVGNSDEDVTIEQSPIESGDRVRVLRGSLQGLEGYATTSQDGNTKITIVIENLFGASVRINPADLQRL